MPQEINLKELERRTWAAHLEDGFIDIIIGCIMLVSALGFSSDELGWSDNLRRAVTIPLMFIGVPIMFLGKKYITTPRLGLVKFGTERMAKNTKQMMIFAVSFVLVNLTLILLGRYSEFGWLMQALIIFYILFIFSVLGFFLDYPKFYLFGIIIGSSELIYSRVRDVDYAGLVIYGIAAVVVLGIGIRTLLHFVQKYPLPEEPEAGPSPTEAADGQ